MADFNKPAVSDHYLAFAQAVRALCADMIKGLDPALNLGTANIPNDAICWNSGTKRWERLNGSTWDPLATTFNINVATADALNGIDLGSMATQNSNAVAITGGAIEGVTLKLTIGDDTNPYDLKVFSYTHYDGQLHVGKGEDTYNFAPLQPPSNVTMLNHTFGTGCIWNGDPVPVAHGGTGTTDLTGLIKGNGTGAFSAAAAGVDYQSAININGMLKGTGGGGVQLAVAGTDYQAPIPEGTYQTPLTAGTHYQVPITATGLLKASGGVVSAAAVGTDYQAPIAVTQGLLKATNQGIVEAMAGLDYQLPINPSNVSSGIFAAISGMGGAAIVDPSTVAAPKWQVMHENWFLGYWGGTYDLTLPSNFFDLVDEKGLYVFSLYWDKEYSYFRGVSGPFQGLADISQSPNCQISDPYFHNMNGIFGSYGEFAYWSFVNLGVGQPKYIRIYINCNGGTSGFVGTTGVTAWFRIIKIGHLPY